MNLKLFNKNVRVVLTDGEIFEGLFEEYYEEDNTIIINGIELNIDEIKEINNIYYETKKDSIKNTIKDIKGELKNGCYCKFCEKKIDTDSKYCKNCGKRQ